MGKNGQYLVDPDGEMISSDPISVSIFSFIKEVNYFKSSLLKVNCIFDENEVITELPHFQEKPLIVDHCDSIGCYKQDIDYGVPLSQIEALISLSENCEQFISFGCLLAPLANEDQLLGGWLDRSGMTFLL